MKSEVAFFFVVLSSENQWPATALSGRATQFVGAESTVLDGQHMPQLIAIQDSIADLDREHHYVFHI
jgi:hypothetical protein